MKALDLTGQRFGRLTVLRRMPSEKGRCQWACVCDCGARVKGNANSLRMGKARSCGCLQKEAARVNGATVDGSANIKHGLSGRPEYFVWKSMKQRCSARASKDDRALYFDRGIRVCEQWRESFEAFFADMGPRPSSRHSIDRVNNDGAYEPGNCQWATSTQQARSRRKRSCWRKSA